MSYKTTTSITALLFGLIAFSQVQAEECSEEIAAVESMLLSRTDNLPVENFEDATDPYLEGYIQALIDIHFYEYRVTVSVKDHHVFLDNLPKNQLTSSSIISFVEDLPGVVSVQVEKISSKEVEIREKYVEQPRVNGIWFPQTTVLFEPLLADPREPYNYAAFRFGDKVIGDKVAAVAIGDDFPLFRWRDVFRWHGDLQIGIQGGIWAVFNFSNGPFRNDETCELINTDYFLGIPLTYAYDRWAFRARLYHISSHLGDELMANDPSYVDKRKNPSFEAIELISSYQLNAHLRLYGGPGIILHSDQSFPMKTFYAKYGMEAKMFGQKLYYHQLYGTPFLAVELENWQIHDWNVDLFVKLGYEFSKLQAVGRSLGFYASYHYGYSYEGQFFLERTQYGEVGFSWGF